MGESLSLPRSGVVAWPLWLSHAVWAACGVWAVPPIGVTMTCVTSSLAMYSRPC